MKKILTLAFAAAMAATVTAAPSGNNKVTFDGVDNVNWTANETATVANGHLSVNMDLQSNEKYRTDLKFASSEAPLNFSPATDLIFAIKFIGARPHGNMTLEFKDADGKWYNTKWKNSPQGTIGTPGGNSIYYYELSRDEAYTAGSDINVVALNLKIADCVVEPYSYIIDWIATYPSVDALNEDAAWADDANDKDEQINYDNAVLYSSVTGNVFADLASAIEGAVDDDQIVINQNVELKDRMTISKNITFTGAKDNITITRNFKNKLFLIIAKETEVTFDNVTFYGNSEGCSTPFIENNGKLNLKDVTFLDIKSAHNQGIVAIKQGGRLTADNVEFNNCEVSDADGRRSTFFLGTNCSIMLSGDCGTASVYIEKAVSAIEAGDLTNTTPIAISLGELDSRELGSVVVKNCTDDAKFKLVNSGYLLVAEEGNLVLAEFTGINDITIDAIDAEYYDMRGIRINNPTKGIYLVRKGNNVAKIILE